MNKRIIIYNISFMYNVSIYQHQLTYLMYFSVIKSIPIKYSMHNIYIVIKVLKVETKNNVFHNFHTYIYKIY